MSSKQHKYILSGGGTGGHIFPAVSIANELKLQDSNCEILFVGANGKMEMEKVPNAGYKIVGIDIAGLKRKLTFENLLLPFKILKSLNQAKKIILDFNPDIVIGTGGFASGPIMRAAANQNIKTLIQEQNSFPGITNKILSKKASKICVAYEGLEKFFDEKKIKITGNPVRQDIKDISNKRDAANIFFKLDPNKRTILIIGGSLGAKTINESIEKNIGNLYSNNLQIVWQTGKSFFNIAKNIDSEEKGFRVFEFIKEMDLAYACADIIVSRAGASSISELCIVGKPCILVPSPNVAEDHQTKNAMALVSKSAAILISDKNCKETIWFEIKKLISDEILCRTLSNNISSLSKPNAVKEIVAEIFELIK
jgi:UDP-N-acetylglucosamine--N-acetylmuramyl-(pentapeptide) pyrophosphoryl-undecaprenol N-acetylglucosamine transferase